MRLGKKIVWTHIFLPVMLAVGVIALVFVTISAPPKQAQAQATCQRYVLGVDASDTSDCSDEADPCLTIQYAIDQSVDGDRICVASHPLAGALTYAESLVITKSVTLDGAWQATCVSPHSLTCSFWAVPCNPISVTLDAGGAGRVISITGHITPVIDCFTITGGDAAGQGGDPGSSPSVDNDAGGGIYGRYAAPIIINNVITGNYGCITCPVSYGRGGGIYLLDAPATAVITNNVIQNNVADESTWGKGGGIMLRDSDACVLSNTIAYNRAGHSAGDGGGVAVTGGMPTIADNHFHHNVAGQGVRGLGGGIYVSSATPATIESNLLEYNQALKGVGDPSLISRGGGIYYEGSPTVTAVISGNTIYYNLASAMSPMGYGGGLYIRGLVTPSLVSSNTVTSNIAGHNCDGKGGGIYVDDCQVTIADNEICENSATWSGSHGEGGGLYIGGGAAVVRDNDVTLNNGTGFPGFPSTAVGYGGGMAISDSLTIVQDNWIVGNIGTNAEADGWGGGVYGFGGVLGFEGNTIGKNLATKYITGTGTGGGLYLEQTFPWLEANRILSNIAASGSHGRGGAAALWSCSAFTLTNNIVAGNSASEWASGLDITANSIGEVVHNTIVQNDLGDGVGVGVSSSSDVTLTNNIVATHTVGIQNIDAGGSTVRAQYTLYQGNSSDYNGSAVTNLSPVAGPARLSWDFHLKSGSGAINHAVPVNWVTNDIDGDPRPVGLASDVGADEVVYYLFLPLMMRNYP